MQAPHYQQHQQQPYQQQQVRGHEIPTYSLTTADLHQHYQQNMGALRQQTQLQQHQPVNVYSISEVVVVPDALTEWAVGGHIQSVLLKV